MEEGQCEREAWLTLADCQSYMALTDCFRASVKTEEQLYTKLPLTEGNPFVQKGEQRQQQQQEKDWARNVILADQWGNNNSETLTIKKRPDVLTQSHSQQQSGKPRTQSERKKDPESEP